MEKIIAIGVGLWFCLTGLITSLAVDKSFDDTRNLP